MKQSKAAVPASTAASDQAFPPTQLDVKINALHPQGPVLATASVNLNGCFAVRGVRVVEGSKGIFVSMPSYRAGSEYKDVCFPCTKQFKQQFDYAVLDAYQQQLSLLPQRQQDAPEPAAPTMNL